MWRHWFYLRRQKHKVRQFLWLEYFSDRLKAKKTLSQISSYFCERITKQVLEYEQNVFRKDQK